MAIEDYLEPEVAVTAVVTAAVFSPQLRGFLRRGLVYATAGVLMAGDALGSFGRGVSQGVHEATASGEAKSEQIEIKGTSRPAQGRRRAASKPATGPEDMSGGEDRPA